MAPTVGTEMRFEDLVTELIHLECDAIAACEAVMDRLSDAAPIDEVGRFRNDHRQHLEVLTEMAHEAEAEAPTEGDMKEMLTVPSRAIIRSFLEEVRPLSLPVLEGVDGRSTLEH